MAKKIYASTGELSNEVTKMYGSVGGLSSNIVKGYCSVGGLSKQFFGASSAPITSSWWYETVNKTFLSVTNKSSTTYTYSKDNMGIAYWAVITKEWSANAKLSFVILASPDPSAVLFRRNDGDTYYSGVYVTVNNEQWYYAIGRIGAEVASATPNYILPTAYQGEAEWGDIIEDFVSNYVYASDFSQEYQVEQSYNLNSCNIEKALRKTMGIYLFKNIGRISNWVGYQTFLEHVDDIVDYVNEHKGNYTTAQIVVSPYKTAGVPPDYGINVYVRFVNSESSTLLQTYYESDGYESFYTPSRAFIYGIDVTMNGSGQFVTHSEAKTGQGPLFVGEFFPSFQVETGKSVWSSNLGLNLN